MEKSSKELMKEFVNSQKFTSTADIMNSMKELFMRLPCLRDDLDLFIMITLQH